MTQVPGPTARSTGPQVQVLLNSMGPGTCERLCGSHRFPSASPPPWLVGGLGTVTWTSPASSCFAFFLGLGL